MKAQNLKKCQIVDFVNQYNERPTKEVLSIELQKRNDINENSFREIAQLIKELTEADQFDTVSYAAEAGQFEKGGFPSIICGPGDIAQAHRANEFVSKTQLKRGVELIQKLIVKFS